jgi:hypothetical protein
MRQKAPGDVKALPANPATGISCSGAPRPMKMGTIVSPWRYDTAARRAPIGKSARPLDFALRDVVAPPKEGRRTHVLCALVAPLAALWVDLPRRQSCAFWRT